MKNTLKTGFTFNPDVIKVEVIKNEKGIMEELIIIDEPKTKSNIYQLSDITRQMISKQIGLPFELINLLDEDFTKKSLVSLQNKLSSPGSLASSEKSSEIFFTKEQVLKMSHGQISQNYDIIRKSQQKW